MGDECNGDIVSCFRVTWYKHTCYSASLYKELRSASELRSIGSLHINSTFLPISKVLHPLYIGDLRRDGKEGQALVS